MFNIRLDRSATSISRLAGADSRCLYALGRIDTMEVTNPFAVVGRKHGPIRLVLHPRGSLWISAGSVDAPKSLFNSRDRDAN